MEPIPFSPVHLGEAEIAEVIDTLRSVWITTGPKVAQFESEFSDWLGGVPALAVNSATAAMHLALLAMGVSAGDVVVTSTMTFCSTAHVIDHCGARPYLVDVEDDTLNLDPDLARDAVERLRSRGHRVVGVLPVHYGGHPVDEGLITWALDNDLIVVEDAAHAVGAAWENRPVGLVRGERHGVAFSFYATKNLTTAEGGMLMADQAVVDESRIWSLHGMSRDSWNRYSLKGKWYYEVDRVGFKYNLTDIAAAIGIHQLRSFEGMQRRRRELAERYSSAFESVEHLRIPTVRPGHTSAWHLYPVRVLPSAPVSRQGLIDALGERKIGTSVHFIPLHLQPVYRDRYGLDTGSFPVAGAAFEQLVSLPLHPHLSDADQDRVIEAVIDTLARP